MTLLRVVLPIGAHCVVLEDSEMRITWFENNIPNITVCRSVDEFKKLFEQPHPMVDFIFFDHDLGEGGSGLDAVKFLVERFGGTSRWGLIHSWNRNGAREMQKLLPGVQHIPFGEFEIEFE
jgi:hypothetical protein